MRVSTITKTVKVTISNKEVLRHFVKALAGELEIATGKQQTFYYALGRLVGISDVEAVRTANKYAKKENRITTDEFRRWLPTALAEYARLMLETTE